MHCDNSDESALKELVDFFQKLESAIKNHKEKLGYQFIGDRAKPSAADYLIWPWIERSQALKIISPGKLHCTYNIARTSRFDGGELSIGESVSSPPHSLGV